MDSFVRVSLHVSTSPFYFSPKLGAVLISIIFYQNRIDVNGPSVNTAHRFMWGGVTGAVTAVSGQRCVSVRLSEAVV